ncbi:MAG: chromate resistance protein ChrB domain-containing protein, partial [Candidatus Binatia bacterium]
EEDVPRILPDVLAARLGSERPPVVLDLRGRAAFEQDPVRIRGAEHVLPDRLLEWAASRPRTAVVAYCS